MNDPNELRALKASLRGVADTSAALASVQTRVESLDEHGDIPPDELDELHRVTLAHAVASAALRGLVQSMQTRRSAPAS